MLRLTAKSHCKAHFACGASRTEAQHHQPRFGPVEMHRLANIETIWNPSPQGMTCWMHDERVNPTMGTHFQILQAKPKENFKNAGRI